MHKDRFEKRQGDNYFRPFRTSHIIFCSVLSPKTWKCLDNVSFWAEGKSWSYAFFSPRKKRGQIVHHSSLELEERNAQSYNANTALPQSLYVTQRTWGNLFKHIAQSAYWLWVTTCLSPNILTRISWRSVTWLRRQDLHIHTVSVQRLHSTWERPKLVPENPEALNVRIK